MKKINVIKNYRKIIEQLRREKMLLCTDLAEAERQEKKKFLVDSDGNITPLTDREQDYRTWIIDMFHKYNRDDLIALMVQKGEESILAGLLKEQEAVPVKKREVLNMMYVWCCGSCGVAITDGDKYCRMCGKAVKWERKKNEDDHEDN